MVLNVAIMNTTPDTMLQVLKPNFEEQKAAVCVFYSIVSSKRGLAGIELGNSFLKTVAKGIGNEIPGIVYLILF